MERTAKENIEKVKLYLGPMSKNIVDSIIDYNNEHKLPVGIIASRRQIEYTGGYVNNWSTIFFDHYIRQRSQNTLICRDHGGPMQGSIEDDGEISLTVDSVYMDIIHIDPFKYLKLEDAIFYTKHAINKCSSINKNVLFEIGTEESIYQFNTENLDYFINKLKLEIPKYFDKIIYVVIQSGTSLKSGINTGTYDEERLHSMISVCQKYGVLSKEHNGDYLSPEQIKAKFNMGLSAINIAPEIAHIETEYILQNISNEKRDIWYQLCINDGKWKKWFPENFNPNDNKDIVIKLCGHYVFTNYQFNFIFDLRSAFDHVKRELYKFIDDRI